MVALAQYFVSRLDFLSYQKILADHIAGRVVNTHDARTDQAKECLGVQSRSLSGIYIIYIIRITRHMTEILKISSEIREP